MKKSLSTLGLCKKAGKLITGFDAVITEMRAEKSALRGVVLASDLSPKTVKEVGFYAEKYHCPVKTLTMEMTEIEGVLKKKTGVLGILDEGLFKSLSD